MRHAIRCYGFARLSLIIICPGIDLPSQLNQPSEITQADPVNREARCAIHFYTGHAHEDTSPTALCA